MATLAQAVAVVLSTVASAVTSAATPTIVMVHVWACFKGKGVGFWPRVMLLRVLPLLHQLLLLLLLLPQCLLLLLPLQLHPSLLPLP